MTSRGTWEIARIEELREMALQQHSTVILDLTNLPDRLDDETLVMVQAIASEPLPPHEPCGDRHLKQCLRVMLAVLPKRNQDEISGELFVAAYQKKLGSYCDSQISFLADKAMERCQWFPTIAECIEIIGEWRRADDAVRRKFEASRLVQREMHLRNVDRRPFRGWNPPEITQDMVDEMSEQMISIGLGCGALREDDTGKVRPWFLKPGEEMPY